MKFWISLNLVFFLHIPFGYSQLDSTFSKTDKKILDKIEELHSKKIDTIVCYYIYCNDGFAKLMLPDSCIAYDIKYLFWIDNNKYYIQRFDECKEYTSLSTNASIFNLVKHKYLEIQKERLKSTMIVDHFCTTKIEIYTGKKLLRKHINWPDLDRYWYEKHLNKDYAYNKKTTLNKLKTIIERYVNVYNKALVTKKTP